ncbi:MAG: hypothetical protein WCK81_03200 [Betaproteobacteria bacterium]
MQAPTLQYATAFYRSAEHVRSRSVSDTVLVGLLDVPAPPPRLVADWTRDMAQQLALAPGDVEALPLARARLRWPDYHLCVQAVADWTRTLGLADLLAQSEVALMACRGARYHHDAAQYGGAAFCNLFLSDDLRQDLHFPLTGQRVALRRGTVVLFDTGQPHAVIPRQRSSFAEADFPPDRDCAQVFLTWELPIETPALAQALGIAFDPAPATALQIKEPQLWHQGVPGEVCPRTGRWLAAGSPLD